MMSISRLSFIYLLMMSMFLMFLGLFMVYKDLVYLIEWEIISINSVVIIMTILLDWMSLLFMSFVLLISSLVIWYSESYMSTDYNINRFMILVLMFVFSMMLMIVSPNLISILLGWDGLGLVSYCLVIYYQNIKSYSAGMLTVLMNRVGDVTLLLSIAWMLNYGSWNYIFYFYYMSDYKEMIIIASLLMISAMTKSAQIPFSAWLPAAMAAPTPVSALVHSSTLVTAGVYLLIRFNYLIMNTNLNMILLLLGSLTMFMSGLGANYEFDLKKIIALSTLSQLGLMMSTLSLGFISLAFFHLIMHALFKALLFLCAGSVIHMFKDFQDIRFMGSIAKMIPLIGVIFGTANLALSGLPFLAGFYSKDLILESLSVMNFNFIIYLLFYISVGLTVCYSFRLVMNMYMYMYKFNSMSNLFDYNDLKMNLCCVLFFMSVIGGSMFSWLMFMYPKVLLISMKFKLMVLMMIFMGVWLGMNLSKLNVSFLFMPSFMSMFMGSMWYLSIISVYLIKMPLKMGLMMMKNTDQGWFEFMGSQHIYLKIKQLSIFHMNYQNNMFMLFMITMFFWVMIVLFMYLF
uniref:NADH dehydrogenase subunit 5 n=1 Tax=Ctenophthalmus quadratus TaxID=3032178 RepID=UPI0023F030C6|nr:NADH dehydrogenase subunit 5 [Ctenophthalmus quadratus]WEF75073.1 NADH dehydrogenase subunit 5 [Ctenophthalmus quadratus]